MNRRLTQGVLVALVAALMALPAAAPSESSAAVPKRFWGVNPVVSPSGAEVARLKRGRVDTVRYPIYWSVVERDRGSFDWSGFDGVLARAAARNIDVLPYVYGTPSWLAGDSRTLPVATKAQRGAWARFLRAAVRRYGRGGTFWRERPGLRRLPVKTWQLWNEQNYFYFAKPVSPRRYAALLKHSARVMRGVDPRVKILLGGMFGWPAARPPRAYRAAGFLRRMYRIKGVRQSFDGVALHPYSPSAKYVKPQVRGIRRAMRAFGDGRKGLWITEISWASSRPGTPFGKGRKGQARELGRAFSVLRRNQRRWRLRRVFWFSLTDDPRPEACSFCDASGLFTARFRAKPAWHRFVSFTGGRP